MQLEKCSGGTLTPTPTPTPTPVAACVGDCNGDGTVTIDELITMVNIALGNAAIDACPGENCSNPFPGVIINCVVKAVGYALNGCSTVTPTATPTPTETPAPLISLELRLDRTPGTVRITAQLTNAGEPAVFYLAGCSALCRPTFYRAVSFQVSDPDGAEVIVKSNEYPYPCGTPTLCPIGPQQIAPGESLDEVLEIDGTAWKQDSTGGGHCGVCTADPFKAGRFTVTAKSSYFTDPESTDTSLKQVETSVAFDWP